MKRTALLNLVLLLVTAVLAPAANSADSEALPPIADAGLSRYTAEDPVVLDGTGSYDPDDSGILSYTWRQIAGPSIVIIDANTATPTIAGSFQPGSGRSGPTIGGFTQTDAIQECEFELVVRDGELTSLPDTVKVIIVPDFGASTLRQENPPFDPKKPTIIYFGGGDCVTGGGRWGSWYVLANVISSDYGPDTVEYELWRTYYQYGDMIIVYLSAVAPDYKQSIQTIGWSTGGMPAIDVGIHLNRVYADVRYAVNRVTHLDVNTACRLVKRWPPQQPLKPWDVYWDVYLDTVELFLTSSVDGEQCWIDYYYGATSMAYVDEPFPSTDILWVSSGLGHSQVQNWYRNSLTGNDMNNFNSGVVAGAYWSVIGPGKNLQLSPQTDAYYFRWDGTQTGGSMGFFNEGLYPGRLPQPVTLVGPEDGAVVDANGALLSCEESENAVGYQLLFGPDPYHLVYLFSDTPSPPTEIITTFPFEETWWTVKVRDQYGSTIYADPVCIYAEDVKAQTIENASIWKTYSSIQNAINDAYPGDEIVVSPGICQYIENIDFKGKNLTVRSTDPNDPAVVAATIINGGDKGSVVTFSSGEDANCVLAGFTITDANNGIYCFSASPTITNCSISANINAGIKLSQGSNPTISNCRITDNGGAGIEMWAYKGGRVTIFNCPIITNCTIAGHLQHGISGGVPTITNSIIWDNSPQQIADTQVVFSVTYSDIQGGFAGEGNIDAAPLFADPDNGDYHLKSQAGRWDPNGQSWVVDEVTSPCIDAGDPGTPVGLEPLPNGGIINMGAYGGTPQASMSFQSQ